MSSLTEYYGRAKSGFASIDPKDMAQLGEDWMVVAATGATVGLVSGAIGGLDHKVAGFNIPVDGLISVGLGFAGLQMKGDTGKILKIASIAAGGSAAARTFEKFFKAGFKAHGEFEELGSGVMGLSGDSRFHGAPVYGQIGYGVGFGAGEQDRLVEAAKYL